MSDVDALAAKNDRLREAAQAYIDWRDRRLALWEAVVRCGHTDPFCPEMLAVRDSPLDKDAKYDDAIRAALAAQPQEDA